MSHRLIDSQVVMAKANKLRKHGGKYYRASMKKAMEKAYFLADAFETRISQQVDYVSKDAANMAYADGNDIYEMELSYFLHTNPHGISEKYLAKFL